MAREGQRKVKARPKQCQGEVKHNLNRNYNLMGFDTIEINLVLQISFHVNLMKTVVNSNKMMQKICF